jgi:hypothetical protein
MDPTVLEEGDYVSKIGIDGSALFKNDNSQVMVDFTAEIQCPINSKADLGTEDTQWRTLAATGITGATITTTTPAVATITITAQGITAVVGTAVQQTTATGTATGTLTAALTTASTTILVKVTTGTFTTTAALEIGSPPFVATLASAWTALDSKHCVKMFQLQVTSNQEGVLPPLSNFGLDIEEVIILGHTSLYPWKPKALPNSELIDQDTRIDKAGLYVKALTRVKEGSPLSQLELFPSELWWDGTILKYNTSTHVWERALSLTAAIKKTLKLTEDGTIVLKSFEIYIGETDPKFFAEISATIEVTLPGSEEKLMFTLAGSITKEYHLSMTGTTNGDFQFDHFDKAISGRVKDCTLAVEASLVGSTLSNPFNGLSIEFRGLMTLGDDTIDATLEAHFPQANGQLMISLDILVNKPMVLSDILGPGTDIGSFGIDEGQLNLKILFGPENAKEQISELDFFNKPGESLSRVTEIYMEQVTLTLNPEIKLYGLDGQAKIHMMYNSESDTTSVRAEVGITGNVEELFAALGGGNSATVNKLGETIEEISGGIVYFQPVPSAGKDAKYTITTLDEFKGNKVKPGLHYMASLTPKTDSSLSAAMKFFDGKETKKNSGAIIMQGQIMELKLVSACVEEILEGVVPTSDTAAGQEEYCHTDNIAGEDIVGGVINIDGKSYLGHPNDNYWEPEWKVTIDIVLGSRVTLISMGDLKLVVTKASLFVRESGEFGANANFELTMNQKLLEMSGDVVLNQKNPNNPIGRNTIKATLTMDQKIKIDVGEIAISAGDFSLTFAWNYNTDFSSTLPEWNPEFYLRASISVGNVDMLGEIKYNFEKGSTQLTSWYDTTTGQADTVGDALVNAGVFQDTTLVTMKNTPILSGFVKSLLTELKATVGILKNEDNEAKSDFSVALKMDASTMGLETCTEFILPQSPMEGWSIKTQPFVLAATLRSPRFADILGDDFSFLDSLPFLSNRYALTVGGAWNGETDDIDIKSDCLSATGSTTMNIPMNGIFILATIDTGDLGFPRWFQDLMHIRTVDVQGSVKVADPIGLAVKVKIAGEFSLPMMQDLLGEFIRGSEKRLFYIHGVEFGGAIELPLSFFENFDLSTLKNAFSVGVAAKMYLDLSFGGAVPALPLVTGHVKIDVTAGGVRAFVRGGMQVEALLGIDGFHANGEVVMELTLGWAGGLPSTIRFASTIEFGETKTIHMGALTYHQKPMAGTFVAILDGFDQLVLTIPPLVASVVAIAGGGAGVPATLGYIAKLTGVIIDATGLKMVVKNWNIFELLLTVIRDEAAREALAPFHDILTAFQIVSGFLTFSSALGGKNFDGHVIPNGFQVHGTFQMTDLFSGTVKVTKSFGGISVNMDINPIEFKSADGEILFKVAGLQVLGDGSPTDENTLGARDFNVAGPFMFKYDVDLLNPFQPVFLLDGAMQLGPQKGGVIASYDSTDGLLGVTALALYFPDKDGHLHNIGKVDAEFSSGGLFSLLSPVRVRGIFDNGMETYVKRLLTGLLSGVLTATEYSFVAVKAVLDLTISPAKWLVAQSHQLATARHHDMWWHIHQKNHYYHEREKYSWWQFDWSYNEAHRLYHHAHELLHKHLKDFHNWVAARTQEYINFVENNWHQVTDFFASLRTKINGGVDSPVTFQKLAFDAENVMDFSGESIADFEIVGKVVGFAFNVKVDGIPMPPDFHNMWEDMTNNMDDFLSETVFKSIETLWNQVQEALGWKAPSFLEEVESAKIQHSSKMNSLLEEIELAEMKVKSHKNYREKDHKEKRDAATAILLQEKKAADDLNDTLIKVGAKFQNMKKVFKSFDIRKSRNEETLKDRSDRLLHVKHDAVHEAKDLVLMERSTKKTTSSTDEHATVLKRLRRAGHAGVDLSNPEHVAMYTPAGAQHKKFNDLCFVKPECGGDVDHDDLCGSFNEYNTCAGYIMDDDVSLAAADELLAGTCTRPCEWGNQHIRQNLMAAHAAPKGCCRPFGDSDFMKQVPMSTWEACRHLDEPQFEMGCSSRSDCQWTVDHCDEALFPSMPRYERFAARLSEEADNVTVSPVDSLSSILLEQQEQEQQTTDDGYGAECKCDNGVGTLECDELKSESDRAYKCASCNKGYHHVVDDNKCEFSGMTRAKVKEMLHDHPNITLTDKEFLTFFNKIDSDKDGVVTQKQLSPELAKLIKDPEEEAKEASDKSLSNSIQKQFSSASQKAHVSGSVTNLRTNSR